MDLNNIFGKRQKYDSNYSLPFLLFQKNVGTKNGEKDKYSGEAGVQEMYNSEISRNIIISFRCGRHWDCGLQKFERDDKHCVQKTLTCVVVSFLCVMVISTVYYLGCASYFFMCRVIYVVLQSVLYINEHKLS